MYLFNNQKLIFIIYTSWAAFPSNTLHICVPKSKIPLKRLDSAVIGACENA